MTDTFQNGGINTTTQTYTNPVTVNPNASNTVTNAVGGQFLFEIPPGQASQFYGNLVNSGLVSYVPSAAGAGNSFYMGSGSSDTLTQTHGTISYKAPSATSGSSVYLQYGTINNDANSLIDIETGGASTIDALNVSNLTNAGTIKIVDTNGTGMTSDWGNGTGLLLNTGSFTIDNSAATSGSTTDFNFDGITNAGTFALTLPAASTSIMQTNAGGLNNSGTLSITSEKSGGGNIQIDGTGKNVNSGTINITDASVLVEQPVTGSGTWNLSNGASVHLLGYGTETGQTFNFSGGDNTLTVDAGTGFAGVMRGFSQGDTLNVIGVVGTPKYDPQTGILTVDGQKYDFGIGYTGTFSDSGGRITYSGAAPACFLTDTMIACPGGAVAVQNLKIGDPVTAVLDGHGIVRKITWVGRHHVEMSTLSKPDDHYPIRVRKDAIAVDVPFKDLLLTGEHCLFLNGAMIPVRMLVNGRTIAPDRTIGSYEFFHIETDPHSIIVADGAACESYLDTGNRRSFQQDGVVASLPGRTRSWAFDAAAPLVTDAEFVKPIWAGLADRATELGFAAPEAPVLTIDPDLHIVTDSGLTVRPILQNGNSYTFAIPDRVSFLHLCSRTARPADIVGPYMDDRRNLGVLVRRILFTGSHSRFTDQKHLFTAELAGWHALEANAEARWTNGTARVPVDGSSQNGPCLLYIEIIGGGPYLVDEQCSKSDRPEARVA